MSQMLLINPSKRGRRRRKSGARKHRRGARRAMSALQRKYFGGGRKRRASPRRRARSRRRSYRANPYLPVLSNPRRRRHSRRRHVGHSRRRYRRNPIGGRGMSLSVRGLQTVVVDSTVGAAGAVGVDLLMGQATKFLPASLASKYDVNTGGINWGYLGVKAGVAVVLGTFGARFLPGRFKGVAAKAAAGSLTVMAYELLRPLAEQYVTLGYYNPATAARQNRVNGGRLNAYLPRTRLRGTTFSPAGAGSQSMVNSEGYVL